MKFEEEELILKLITNEYRYEEKKYPQTKAVITRVIGELINRENKRRRENNLPLTWEDKKFFEDKFIESLKKKYGNVIR